MDILKNLRKPIKTLSNEYDKRDVIIKHLEFKVQNLKEENDELQQKVENLQKMVGELSVQRNMDAKMRQFTSPLKEQSRVSTQIGLSPAKVQDIPDLNSRKGIKLHFRSFASPDRKCHFIKSRYQTSQKSHRGSNMIQNTARPRAPSVVNQANLSGINLKNLSMTQRLNSPQLMNQYSRR